MSLFAGGMPIGIDGEEKVKIAAGVVDDPIQGCDEKGRTGEGTDCLTQPLLPRTNNDVSRAHSNCDNYTNTDHHENSTTPTQRDDEENNNYVPLIDDHHGDDGDDTNINVDGNITDFDGSPNEAYSLDSLRFAVLAIFCLNNLIGSAAWISFAPIEDAVKAKFREYDGKSSSSGISSQQINWLSMISMAVYGPGTAFCAWVVPTYGFRVTVIASSVIMALGCFLRWLSLSYVSPDGGATSNEYSSSTFRYFILLTGQGLVALGQTIFMNAPARVAASWFQQTTKAIAAINLCSSIGIIFGQVLSPLCVVEATGEHLDQLLAAQGVAMGICALFTGYGFRYEEPACPPSAAESVRRRERQRQSDHSSSHGHTVSSTSSVSKDVRKLLTNPQYIILIVAFGINYGLNGAIVTLMQPWVASSGFPGDQVAGLCGSLLIGGGLIGTWIASILLDYTRDFNQAIRWSFASTVVVALGLVATLRPESPTWLLATAFTITGMTQMPLLTICFDAVAAHTYPVSEELSSAGLQLVGQYLGIFLVDGMSYLIESASSGANDDDSNGQKRYGFAAEVNIFYISLLGISAVIACCYKSDDLRGNITNDREIQNSGSQTTALLEDINSHAYTNDNHELITDNSDDNRN
jgi:FLVCR family feline leukemia virus subgroup C receptor-related protein